MFRFQAAQHGRSLVVLIAATFATPAAFAYLPSATTGSASAITATGATVAGSVNARRETTSVTFRYQLPSGERRSVAATPASLTGNTVTAVTAKLSGLQCATRYTFQVSATNNSGRDRGDWVPFTTSACGTTTPPPPTTTPPSASSSGPSGVTATAATLNASVTSGSASVNASFDFGTTTGYGTTVAASPASLAASTTAQAVTGSATALTCGTTYHYRVRVSGTAGSAQGSDQVFTTSACATPPTPPAATAPTATTLAASVSASAATLNGSVTPNGAATTVSFEYGTSTAYGMTAAAAPASLAATASSTAEAASVSGLACGTTYHYRVRAANSAGTTMGANASFNTAACATTPPPSGTGKTYTLSPVGSDTNSGLAGSPWKTFAKAWSVLQAGDTLLLADGVYSSASPPAGKSGQSGAPIMVRASNPGGAQINNLTIKGNAWLGFSGLRIVGTDYAVAVYSNGTGKQSHHLTFQEIGFSCTPNTLNDGACFDIGDGTHHLLLEDSWGWGGGRYTVMCYGGPGGSPPNLTCDFNTFRRLVLKQGPTRSSGGNPQAALSLYYSSSNVVENVIAIDGQASSDSSNAAFYLTGHEPPPNADANKYLGVVALNNLGNGFYLDCPGAVCNGTEVRDSVFWGSTHGAIAVQGGTCKATVLDHNTIGLSGSENGYENYGCDGTTLTNNAFHRNQGYGARQSGSGSTTVNHHNGYFGNALGARSGLAVGTADLASDAGFSYLTRIEATSPYKNAGSVGDIGANVLNRYQDGVLTATPLWPWPNEARMRAEMCASSTGAFCSSGKSLTKYIWEYLGKPMP